MDWLKVRCSLSTDPRVLAVADAIDQPVAAVMGGLLMLWSAASVHSDEGTLPRATPGSIDRLVGLRGFADALVAVDWLRVERSGAVIPRWDEHNSDTARRRAENAARMARERAGKSNASAKRVQKKTHTSNTDNARAAHQEQEQEKKTPPPPPADTDEPGGDGPGAANATSAGGARPPAGAVGPRGGGDFSAIGGEGNGQSATPGVGNRRSRRSGGRSRDGPGGKALGPDGVTDRQRRLATRTVPGGGG